MPRQRTDRDYYAILGVGPRATEDEIRRAFRRLALEWHPDRNPGNPAAAERFTEISEAYGVLMDPARRRAWDAARAGGGGFHASREDIFRDLFADPRASAVFEEIARELERLGLRVDRHDFERTLFGGRAVVSGTVIVISPFAPLRLLARLGRAALGAAGRRLLGRPRLARRLGAADVTFPLRLTAAEAAAGGKKRVTLSRADGEDAVVVTIPAGVTPGTRLRLRGKGRRRAGGRGDVYLVVEVGG
jgi:curved DNA-binding protein